MKNNEIYFYIERLSELLRLDSRKTGHEYGLHPVQLEALHYLSNCNKYSDTPMAVTEYLGQTKGTTSQTLKILEKKGFLKKYPDQNDKRITHLKITDEGRQFINQSIPTSMFDQALNTLSKNESDGISKSLKKLLTCIITTNKIKPYGVCHSCYYNQKQTEGGYYCRLLEKNLNKSETQLICKEHKPK